MRAVNLSVWNLVVRSHTRNTAYELVRITVTLSVTNANCSKILFCCDFSDLESIY